jgi:hypothetical protein
MSLVTDYFEEIIEFKTDLLRCHGNKHASSILV